MSLLEIGQIVRPHGLRGEVVVTLVTTRLDRLAPGTVLQAAATGSRERPSALRILASRPFQHRYLVTFEDVSSRESAERLRGLVLLAEPEDAPSSELYVHQLIGKRVVDQGGTARGAVVAVEANPASDLLVLEGGALVPLRFVAGVEGETITVEVPMGLFE